MIGTDTSHVAYLYIGGGGGAGGGGEGGGGKWIIGVAAGDVMALALKWT